MIEFSFDFQFLSLVVEYLLEVGGEPLRRRGWGAGYLTKLTAQVMAVPTEVVSDAATVAEPACQACRHQGLS